MYNYSKFTQYAYLIAGVLLGIESYRQFAAGETNKAIIMGIFTLICVFMFFFRRKYAKKFGDYNKKP